MFVKQISVFVENKSGKLVEIIGILGENNIDICALSIADTTDFGILRLIVNNPDKAQAVLKEQGIIVKATDVIGFAVPDSPGGLAGALTHLKDAGIAIEYMYAFVGKSDRGAMVIVKTDKPEETINLLKENNTDIISKEDVYNL